MCFEGEVGRNNSGAGRGWGGRNESGVWQGEEVGQVEVVTGATHHILSSEVGSKNCLIIE